MLASTDFKLKLQKRLPLSVENFFNKTTNKPKET